jgi:hypothetical protein
MTLAKENSPEKGGKMRRQFGQYSFVFGIALLALFAVVPNSHVKAQDNQNGNIVGSWLVTVDVNTPAGPVPFATELASFNPGGTFVDAISIAFSAQNPAFAGNLAPLAVNFSDALGTWKPIGEDSNQYAATFKRFLFAGPNTPAAAYGSFFPGQNVGQATIEAVATLHTGANGDTATGPFTFQLTNLQGTVVLVASGTFSATRIQIQPLATP